MSTFNEIALEYFLGRNTNLPLATISTPHLRIHEGKGFVAGHFILALADDANLDILIQVGASQSMHTILDVAAGGDATVTIYEGTTFSAAGTALTSFNKLRSSVTPSAATITHTPTITVIGTPLPTKLVAGGMGGNAGGGSDGGFDRELIFTAGTDYLIRTTNIAGQAKPVSSVLEWYEP